MDNLNFLDKLLERGLVEERQARRIFILKLLFPGLETWQKSLKLPFWSHLSYNTRRICWNTWRYALPNVDSHITHLQIYANLNIGEGEKSYTRGKVR